MSTEGGCQAKSGDKLIFSCSGAADVGAVADLAARRLTKEGHGKMFCLAGVGGRVPAIIERTSNAEKILAIDGCELDCVKNCLEHAGFTEIAHVRLADLGMQKGKTAVTDEVVVQVVAAGAEKLK
ncbi:MAG: putative zinc-binding protein [Candidatus Hydrogenedentes bacterium]|nr:putative zinc-binding protein [Candidatus Hydrogenedentota bacterium]